MEHLAFLSTPEENLTDVRVAITDRAGSVVVAPTLAPLRAGTTDTYEVLVTVPDIMRSGRERWSSASAGFDEYSDPMEFTPPNVDVDLTPVLQALNAVAEDTDYIEERLRASAPGDGPVDFVLVPPPPLGTSRLFFFVRDFGVAAELDFTVRMEAPPPLVIQGAYEFDRLQTVTTEGGTGYVDVYPSTTLQAASVSRFYIIECQSLKLKKRVLVPAGASNAALLPHVPGTAP